MQYKYVALSVTTVGTLMAGVDTRIVVVGLPTIARELGANLEDVIWVSQAYLLASTIGLLLIGRVTDVIGRVKIYNTGFIIFTIGSAFSSLSFTPLELIAARVVQGTGAAMLITNSAAILTDASPKAELGTMLGLNQIAFRIGSVAGLTLSGVILAVTDWRALFYINIPIGIFGTVWAHLRLRDIAPKDVETKMDWSGFITFSVSLTMILLSITFLSYGISDALVGWGLAIGGFVLLGMFIRIETHTKAPILDLNLFKIRQFMGGNIAQLLNALAWSGVILMLSFYFQLALNYTPLQAGLALLPLEATYAIFGPLSGKLSDKYGQRLFSTVGLAVSSAGFFLLSSVAGAFSYNELIIPIALLGVGNGMFVSPNISSIMGSVPANRRGIASAFRTTLFNVGLTASYGLAVLLITSKLPYAIFSALVEGVTPQGVTPAAIAELISGFKLAVLVLAVINTTAIVPSFLRGPTTIGAHIEPPENHQADVGAME